MQLLPTIVQTFPIGRVHHPDERISLLEVVLPVCSECLLTSNIPYTMLEGWRSRSRTGRIRTNVQFVAFNFISKSTSKRHLAHSPFIVNRLDDETQRWTDGIHIFVHDFLHNRGLPGVIQPTSTISWWIILPLNSLTASEFSFPCPSGGLFEELTTF